MILLGSITPHILQFIKTAIFRQHHVDHDIHIVDQNPLIGLSAFVFIGELVAILPHLFFYGIGDGLYLGGAGGLANDKKVRYCFGDLSQVNRNDLLTLFLLYCFYDGFENLRIPRQPDYAVALTGS